MFATSKLEVHPTTAAPRKELRPQLPAWMNRLLGVRPTPPLLPVEEPVRRIPCVEGVSTASAYRSYPR